MEEVIPGLHASAPEPLPFAPSLHIRAFLLRRDEGNLLLYAAPTVGAEAERIEQLGGVSRHYLNHWHEASFGCDSVEAPLVCHESDRPSVAEKCSVDETFSTRAMVGDDFELIPTPGHTRGATAYLWHGDEHRCLFTGDSLYLSEGEWIAAVLDSSDRDSYIESLELIRGLDFDVLVPWAASGGQPYIAMTDAADARRRIDAVIERVRSGGDH